jgi:4-nitrophenyl phosphatase
MEKKKYLAILADLDGTLHRGTILIPGADKVYAELSGRGIRWIFITNSAMMMANGFAERISSMGLHARPEQIISSSSALVRVLRQSYSGDSVMVVGEDALVLGVLEAGSIVTDDPDQATVVVVALDRNFSYEKLHKASSAVRKGATFIATNLDATFPAADGFRPGAGSLVAAVAAAAGKPPDRVMGKPHPYMAEIALEVLGIDAASCLVVGDRMDTDILFAGNANMDSALVLTGATSITDLDDYDFSPKYVLENICELTDIFC